MNELYKKTVLVLNNLAEVALVGTMLLIVSNVVLKVFFKSPIKGTYELIGLFTTIFFSFCLAYCAVEGGHITVDYFAKYFTSLTLKTIDLVVNIISFVFWLLASGYLFRYAYIMYIRGEATVTTFTPHYPFVFCVAIGVFALSLVLLEKIIKKGSEND